MFMRHDHTDEFQKDFICAAKANTANRQSTGEDF